MRKLNGIMFLLIGLYCIFIYAPKMQNPSQTVKELYQHALLPPELWSPAAIVVGVLLVLISLITLFFPWDLVLYEKPIGAFKVGTVTSDDFPIGTHVLVTIPQEHWVSGHNPHPKGSKGIVTNNYISSRLGKGKMDSYVEVQIGKRRYTIDVYWLKKRVF